MVTPAPNTPPPKKRGAAKAAAPINTPQASAAGPVDGTLPSAGRDEAGGAEGSTGVVAVHVMPPLDTMSPATQGAVAAMAGAASTLFDPSSQSELVELARAARGKDPDIELEEAALPPGATAQPGEPLAAFELASPLHHNGDAYEIGDAVLLTRVEHSELRAAGVLTANWPD